MKRYIKCGTHLYDHVDFDDSEAYVDSSNISDYTPSHGMVNYLNSLGPDTYMLIHSDTKYDISIEVDEVYIGNSLDDMYNELSEYGDKSNYSILKKTESNSWEVIESRGLMSNKWISSALGIKINRRTLSDEERQAKERKSMVNKAKKYIKHRLEDYIVPEYGFPKLWYGKKFNYLFENTIQEHYPEMIQYVDYWDDPDELNDIDENAADLIKYDGFPDAMIIDFISNYTSFKKVLSDIYDTALKYTYSQDFRIRYGYSDAGDNTHTFLYYLDFKSGGKPISISESEMNDLIEYLNHELPSIESKYGIKIEPYYDDLEQIKFNVIF